MMTTALMAAMFLTEIQHSMPMHEADSIYSFHMTDIDGKEKNLADFKGHVLLVVNVASRCGNTPQYEALEALFEKYRARGFSVLGFPSNDFGAQEPGTDSEIKEFCTSKYNVSFPMFSKIAVKGEDTHPLYKWLISKTKDSPEVSWNFEKFLIDRKGQVIHRFAPKTKPDAEALVGAIEAALNEK